MSEEYFNCNQKLLIKCEAGHIWNVCFDKLRQGRWCPFCYGRKLKSIDDAQVLAKKFSGECISQKYVNSQSYLIWRCKNNHIFKSKYNDVQQGHWCFECSRVSAKEKCIERYGFDNPTKNRDIALKAARNSNKSFLMYHWKSNDELVCIGSYEKIVVEYLNKNKIDFDWQPKVFVMPNGKTYRPDLYLKNKDTWIEIKGYFRNGAMEKWCWFHSQYPNSELWDKYKIKELK